MKIIDRLKAGAKIAPAFLIVLYYLFFSLDLITTYLGSPDLRYEGNLIVRYYTLSWTQFIIFYSSVVLLVTLGLFISWNYLHVNYQNHCRKDNISFFREVFKNIKLLLSLIMLGILYSHVINLGLVVINNILGDIYLHRMESFLFNISSRYISKQPYYLFLIQTIPILIGYVIAIIKVNKIRNKYRALAAEEEN